jgi:hypothetical protein
MEGYPSRRVEYLKPPHQLL